MPGREPEHMDGVGGRGGQEAAWSLACAGDERQPVCARKAKARNIEDQEQIDGFIGSLPGGFDAFDELVTSSIAAGVELQAQGQR